jgi:hypothetical protein
MRRLVATVVVTGFMATAAVTSFDEVEIAPCTNAVFTTILHAGEGPFVCSSGGVKTVIVPARTPLGLRSMRVTLLRTRTAQTLASAFHHAKASGAFLVVTVRVVNHTVTAQRLNPYRQARLRIAAGEYSVSFAGESADGAGKAWREEIPPQRSRTVDLVFEVPRTALQGTSTGVVLVLANFGELLPGEASEVGLIYLGAGGPVPAQPHAKQITERDPSSHPLAQSSQRQKTES